MNFGRRLALFLVVALVVIQGLTAASVYQLLHASLVAAGKKQLKGSEALLLRQLDEVERQISASVKVLTLDFALRQAIAERDHDTVISALRNDGRRVGATRMFLVDLDGRIGVDTARQEGPGSLFQYPDLLAQAIAHGRAGSVVTIDDHVDWLILVPILAPTPIAFVGAVIPLDDHVLQRMQELGALPRTLGLFVATPTRWLPVAGKDAPAMLALLPPPAAMLDPEPTIVAFQGEEDLFLATQLATPKGDRRVVAVLSYPVTEALRQFEGIILSLLGLLLAGLILALSGAWMIARGVSRPIEQLAAQTRRIEAGDYSPPEPVLAKDEIGQLSTALRSMTLAIRDREEHIRYQASHDLTTDLPNRLALAEAMTPLLAQGGAIMVIGLVRLQEIANTVGREIADRLMRDAGNRLRAISAVTNLACIGERSFAACAWGCDPAQALVLGQQIIASFDQPYREGDLTIDAAAAVGVAHVPEHGTSALLLLRHAEVALQSALVAENRLVVYDPSVDPHRPDRLSLMSELRQSLEKGDLQLYYQPKLDLEAGEIGGAEALVRWIHPHRGFVPPDMFIGLAEETGNIQRLTRWALDSGIAQAARWHGMGYALRISINLSVRDLSDPDLPTYVADRLACHGLPAKFLVLEVTESAIMGEPDAAIAVLRGLAATGIALSIDDFGVGQSSLAYLRRLPVQELKLDKTFIQKLAGSQADRAIVRAVTELGHNLGYQVTAEGVEDEETLYALRYLGCDYAQGYHLARALTVVQFEAFLNESRWAAKRLKTGPVLAPEDRAS